MSKIKQDVEALEIDFKKQNGLVPVIVQDTTTKEVLMLAYANEEALIKTLETKKAHYFSRSRDKLWLKGESSGNTQNVKNIYVDCDNDSLIYEVEQKGAACHEGYRSCFFRSVNGKILKINQKRVLDPEKIYKKS